MNSFDPHASPPAPGVKPAASEGYAWGAWARGAASVAVVWHLVGVMVAPLSVSPRMMGGDSVLGAELKKAYGPYITATYLDHSYKFFAPDPGPSHLVRYDLYFADGTSRVNRDDQILPDRQTQWPRLLYHRHFMLTEFMNFPDIWAAGRGPERGGAGGPVAGAEMVAAAGFSVGNFAEAPGGPAGPGPLAPQGSLGPQGSLAPHGPLALPGPLAAAGQGGPMHEVPVADLVERVSRDGIPGPRGEIVRPPLPFVVRYWRATAEYLARRHGAVRVDLFYREHGLPTVEQFREAKRLDPPESFAERLLVSYRAEGAK